MSGKIKVRGDLILAQKLEEIFEKAGGRDVSVLKGSLSVIINNLVTPSAPSHSSSKMNS